MLRHLLCVGSFLTTITEWLGWDTKPFGRFWGQDYVFGPPGHCCYFCLRRSEGTLESAFKLGIIKSLYLTRWSWLPLGTGLGHGHVERVGTCQQPGRHLLWEASTQGLHCISQGLGRGPAPCQARLGTLHNLFFEP